MRQLLEGGVEMSGPSIRVVRDFYAVRVTIDDLVHVWLPTADLIGVHSWLKPKPSIEYILRGGTMVTEYDSREKWELVLCGLEGIL